MMRQGEAMRAADSLNILLLRQVLEAADGLGIDQVRLAKQAGLKPETISRAKKRVDMELNTLARLAGVVGLQVVLQPAKVSSSGPQPKAALSKPRFGLAWSNPDADEAVLLRNALLQGRFDAILEAAAHDGVPFVRQELTRLRESGDIDEVRHARLERMVGSIERGFADAQSHAAA
jgi:DNA-binding phage protein